MKVTLTEHLGLVPVVQAVRMSHDNHDRSDSRTGYKCECGNINQQNFAVSENSDIAVCMICNNKSVIRTTITGEKDKELVERVGNKFKHKSVLEHIVCSFDIDGVSRALLQELARHRTASLTVKSTRYTLKELKDGYEFNIDEYDNMSMAEASKYIVTTGDMYVDMCSYEALCKLQKGVKMGISNDKIKYCLPESYKTRLQWTMDGRNLQSFLQLRSSKDALWEIRMLANALYDALPEDHKYLFSPYVYLEEVE